MEGFIGEIRMFGGTFSPRSWSYCSGQTLAISSNTALFAIIGTIYGGNGTTTFQLPDLRGRVAIGAGKGPGLTERALGELGGSLQNVMTLANMASHTHFIGNGGTTQISGTVSAVMNVNNAAGPESTPSGNYFGMEGGGNDLYANTPSGADTLNASAISVSSALTADFSGMQTSATGTGLPYSNSQPSLGIAYIICTNGIFPPRN